MMKRGPKPGYLRPPANPPRVREIFRLRDEEGLSFLEISQRLEGGGVLTPPAIHWTYNRWQDWYHQKGPWKKT